MLKPDLPYFNDKEGVSVPKSFAEVIDSHIHIFPEEIFSSIWSWFDKNAWPIRYRMETSDLLTFLFKRGVTHIVALQYAHKPGISNELNSYMAGICQGFPGKVTGMATVFPGEKDAVKILTTAFKDGLKGVKLHAHVQCFDMNSKEMDPLYDLCEKNHKPMVMHVGREPKSEVYRCDPYKTCSVEKLESVLKNFPGLDICVPHLGFDEILDYKNLIEKYDTLWLDTAMVLTDYFPMDNKIPLKEYRADRIMYGSDFPNIPYAWDRELVWFLKERFSTEKLEWILHKSAKCFFKLKST